MAFRKSVPQGIQNQILENASKILKDFTQAWQGNDILPYEFVEKDGLLTVRERDGDAEYVIHMVVVSNG